MKSSRLKERAMHQEKKMLQDAAYSEALLNAWITSRYELNRQIITLSTLGLGLLLIQDFNTEGDHLRQMFWLFASGSFLFSIILCLSFQDINSPVPKVSKEEALKEVEKRLLNPQKMQIRFFGAGIILATLLILESPLKPLQRLFDWFVQ